MKKKVYISLSLIFVFVIFIILFLIFHDNKVETFYLDSEYYRTSELKEITNKELNDLIDKKGSFAVFVYQPMCINSSGFESILNDFVSDRGVSIYKIAFSNIKDTEIGKYIKYYPSFIIYHNGKVVDFLEADNDDDTDIYTTKDGFYDWFTKYVKLKNYSSNENNNDEVNNKDYILDDVLLDDVVMEDKKVNIYFFWGDGCPHCEKEFEFFESIKEEYGKHFNLYTFETFYVQENVKLAYTFAYNMGDTLKGIPYTIIGNKSFNGFGEKDKKAFIEAIESQYENSYDVYFDKIKK